MVKNLVLSTGNIVSAGPSIIRKPGEFRSNLELTNSLRSNFLAAKQEASYHSSSSSSSSPPSPSSPTEPTAQNGSSAPATNGTTNLALAAAAAAAAAAATITTTPPTQTPVQLSQWTSESPDDSTTLYIPRLDFATAPGLQEDPAQYDITVKLFFLRPHDTTPPAQRAAHARAALALVQQELRAPHVSLLIVSFPGMSFEGDCEWEADARNASQGDDAAELATWREAVEPLFDDGLVRRLGIAEFGSEKLARFLAGARVKPQVNQINIKNCCNVPPPLVKLAKEAGVELFVHSDCTDVLPKGTLRELLGHGDRGAGVLADPGEGVEEGLRGDLTPQWVVKYTAVVRDRGVIENKGYFAGAALEEEA
ncbi:unnamed protein product [Discula destructiva]